MPAAQRISSTKGKHLVLASPALPKGQACFSCKQRKVRCDGVKPACQACKRTARFENRDPEAVRCCFQTGRKPRRSSSKTSASASASEPTTPDQHGEEDEPSRGRSSSIDVVGGDPNPSPPPLIPMPPHAIHDPDAHLYSLFSSLRRFDSAGSDFSAQSLSTSPPLYPSPTSPTFPAATSHLSESFSYDPPLSSASPVPIADATSYFETLNLAHAPDTTGSSSAGHLDFNIRPHDFSLPPDLAPYSTHSASAFSYPSPTYPSIFTLPDCDSIYVAPSMTNNTYFELPPPLEQLAWPEQDVVDWTGRSALPEGPEW